MPSPYLREYGLHLIFCRLPENLSGSLIFMDGRVSPKIICIYLHRYSAEIAQSVEHQLPKLRVAGSNPVFRSKTGGLRNQASFIFEV